MTTQAESGTLTLDQRRAQHALKSIEATKALFPGLQPDYKSAAKHLPATILMNGLGHACAMLLAQSQDRSADESGHRRLYEHLESWLRGREHAAVYPEDQDLVKAIINHGQDKYVRAQVEALAYLVWLKKFAQAYLAGKED